MFICLFTCVYACCFISSVVWLRHFFCHCFLDPTGGSRICAHVPCTIIIIKISLFSAKTGIDHASPPSYGPRSCLQRRVSVCLCDVLVSAPSLAHLDSWIFPSSMFNSWPPWLILRPSPDSAYFWDILLNGCLLVSKWLSICSVYLFLSISCILR